jgi:hypothetical protein
MAELAKEALFSKKAADSLNTFRGQLIENSVVKDKNLIISRSNYKVNFVIEVNNDGGTFICFEKLLPQRVISKLAKCNTSIETKTTITLHEVPFEGCESNIEKLNAATEEFTKRVAKQDLTVVIEN